MLEQRTSCGKLGIHPLAHNTLQAYTCTHKSDRNKSKGIRPRWLVSSVSNTGLTALPYGKCSGHGEEGLNKCTQRQPGSRFWTHLVTNTTKRSTRIKRQDGGQGLLIGKME